MPICINHHPSGIRLSLMDGLTPMELFKGVVKMSKPIVFDTLNYAKILDKGGVPHSEVHTRALITALSENLYTQTEVDQMIEAALKRFDERTVQIREEMRQEREEIRAEFNKIHMDIKDLRLELKSEIKDVQDNILKRGYTVLVVILGLMTLSSNFIHFSH